MQYTINGYKVSLNIQSAQGKTEYNSKITKGGKIQAVIVDLRSTGHGFAPQGDLKIAELHAVGLHVTAVDMWRKSGKVAHVEIHDMKRGKVRIIKSGDQDAWRSLDACDKSGVKTCIDMMQSITMGKMTFVPVR
tara:strand:+ start:506 stop:907 length:402 start_codon:yes stop_codon:yes gene_type:complete